MSVATVLNQNQFALTPILGSLTQGVPHNVKTCRILPTSTATVLVAGQAVKLVASTSPEIVVDAVASATADVVYGVIIFNPKKNTYAAGDVVEVACKGSVIWLESSAAINRGVKVSTDYTGPTVAGDATASHQITGVTLTQVAGTGTLIAVEIDPSTNPAS